MEVFFAQVIFVKALKLVEGVFAAHGNKNARAREDERIRGCRKSGNHVAFEVESFNCARESSDFDRRRILGHRSSFVQGSHAWRKWVRSAMSV